MIGSFLLLLLVDHYGRNNTTITMTRVWLPLCGIGAHPARRRPLLGHSLLP